MSTDRSATLLVVEDDEEIRELLAEHLRMAGYRVLGAARGEEALLSIERETLDAVLLDVGLPGRDGFDVLAQIRRTHAQTALPVIMLTGASGRESVVRGLRLGANDYVSKPFDFPIILARIETQVALKIATEQGRRLEADLIRRNSELEAANGALAAANDEMRSDLIWAGRLQRSMLPGCSPTAPGVEFAWHYRPCEELGGDLLDVFALDEDQIGFYLLDVSGHGVKAALLSVQISRLLAPDPDQPCLVRRRRDGHGEFMPTPPAVVADELNRRFQLNELEQFFTLFYAVLDTRTRRMRWVAAGHAGPLVLRDGECMSPMQSRGDIAIGVVPDARYAQHEIVLRRGDRVLAVSDGVTDARPAGGQIYGRDQLIQALQASSTGSAYETVRDAIDAAGAWSGRAFEDDVTAIALDVGASADELRAARDD